MFVHMFSIGFIHQNDVHCFHVFHALSALSRNLLSLAHHLLNCFLQMPSFWPVRSRTPIILTSSTSSYCKMCQTCMLQQVILWFHIDSFLHTHTHTLMLQSNLAQSINFVKETQIWPSHGLNPAASAFHASASGIRLRLLSCPALKGIVFCCFVTHLVWMLFHLYCFSLLLETYVLHCFAKVGRQCVSPGGSRCLIGEMFFLEKCMYSIVHELYCEHMWNLVWRHVNVSVC